MSLSAEPVKTFIVDDPRIDFDREASYLIERSGGDVTYRRVVQNSASDSSLSFNVQVPSRDTVVSSKIYVSLPLTVTITRADAVEPAAPILDGLGFRFAPFVTCCNSVSLELNGKTQTSNTYRYYPALMRYCNTTDEMTNDFSCMPTYLDQYSSYNNPSLGAAPWGTVRDPLGPAGYGNCTPFGPTTRKGYLDNLITDVVAVGNTSVTFKCTIQEIIPISPLFWGHREVKGLTGLENMTISFQIRRLERLFSSWYYNQNVPERNLVITVAQMTGAELELTYIKPRANVPIPRMIHYPYNNIKDFITPVGEKITPLAAKQTGEVTFSNIQLSGVPKRMYIFVKRAEAEERYFTTDTFARIDGISLDLGTRSGLLAECSSQTLYRMAVKNGYKGSWDAWYKHVGSVLCIDFGSDVSLDLLDAPGALKQMQVSFRLQFTNLYNNKKDPAGANDLANQKEITFSAYCIVVYDGMLIIKDGEVLFESNDVSALDVADSSKVRKLSYDDIADYVYGGMYTGGSLSKFISKAKTGLSKAKDFAQQKIIPGVQKALPYVEKGVKVAAEVLPALAALGYTEEEIFDIVSGKGGKVMPKKSIKARAARK